MKDRKNSSSPVSEDLRKILSEYTRVKSSRICESTRVIEDLGVDSFTALEILVAIENEFGLKIPKDRISSIETFGDMVKFVVSGQQSKIINHSL